MVTEEVRLPVIEDAEELAQTKNDVRAAVRSGTKPLYAYDEYDVF